MDSSRKRWFCTSRERLRASHNRARGRHEHEEPKHHRDKPDDSGRDSRQIRRRDHVVDDRDTDADADDRRDRDADDQPREIRPLSPLVTGNEPLQFFEDIGSPPLFRYYSENHLIPSLGGGIEERTPHRHRPYFYARSVAARRGGPRPPGRRRLSILLVLSVRSLLFRLDKLSLLN